MGLWAFEGEDIEYDIGFACPYALVPTFSLILKIKKKKNIFNGPNIAVFFHRFFSK